MGYMTHTVTVYLPVREDDAPLDHHQIIEQVRAVVAPAVAKWYWGSPEAQESLAYDPDVDGNPINDTHVSQES